MATTLRGITWNHSRGFTSIVGVTQRYAELHPETDVVWEKRSLSEFESKPIQELAGTYDFLVIDHPWAGFAAKHNVLLPLNEYRRPSSSPNQRENSVGKSFESYNFDGFQSALPIDAASPSPSRARTRSAPRICPRRSMRSSSSPSKARSSTPPRPPTCSWTSTACAPPQTPACSTRPTRGTSWTASMAWPCSRTCASSPASARPRSSRSARLTCTRSSPKATPPPTAPGSMATSTTHVEAMRPIA